MKTKAFLIGGILLFFLLVIGSYFLLTGKKAEEKEKFPLDDSYYQDGKYIEATSTRVQKLLEEKSSFLLFTYNSFCSFEIPVDDIFQEVMDKYHIDVLKIPFEDFKDTKLYDTVKLGPSFLIIKEGTLVDYLDAEADEDISLYQNSKKFEKWLGQYIFFSKNN